MKMFILLILVSGSVYADIFKCKDKTGSVSYSQLPCEEESNTEEFELKKDSPTTINNRERAKTAKANKETEQLKVEKDDKPTPFNTQSSRTQERRKFSPPAKSASKLQRKPNTKLGYKHEGVRIRK